MLINISVISLQLWLLLLSVVTLYQRSRRNIFNLSPGLGCYGERCGWPVTGLVFEGVDVLGILGVVLGAQRPW